MRFTEAFEAMKNGAKVKLPSWAGYWEWDPEKKTIIMHCRAEESDTGNETMDIRESQRVEYTITNMLSDEWMIANEANCPKLGGRQHMFFGDALRMAKRYGKRIAREGWNGKSQYVEIASAISYMNAAGDMQRLRRHCLPGLLPGGQVLFYPTPFLAPCKSVSVLGLSGETLNLKVILMALFLQPLVLLPELHELVVLLGLADCHRGYFHLFLLSCIFRLVRQVRPENLSPFPSQAPRMSVRPLCLLS